MLKGAFATVVPPHQTTLAPPSWMRLEAVIEAPDRAAISRAGTVGVYERTTTAAAASFFPSPHRLQHAQACSVHGPYCVAAEADLLALLAHYPGPTSAALALSALAACFLSLQSGRAMSRYWSFEARFLRGLHAETIICAYQPVMRLDTGAIVGCEVLARWRDVDNATVFPDRFIPLVERHGLTMRFTELVAARAYEELCRLGPQGTPLQVNFNVFPRDVDCGRLLRAFAPYAERPDRFELVLEIIESAQQQIDALRQAGVKVYVDDFGAGYSNMQTVANLAVDGIKLDRCFAMAPDDSLLARMLELAVDMMQGAGRIVVVEGVETQERLEALRSMTARVDHVQGYHISRPLDIGQFEALLAREAPAHEKHRDAA
jgi:EAL domain-containing protein (putative c-di-GMP-specific phosphodiesterase class I)